MSRSSTIGGPDVLLALYYGGGTSGLFDPIGPAPADDDFEATFCAAVLEADPDHVEALAFLGNICTSRGEHERGLALDLRLVRLRPESARGHYNLACTYALLGRSEDAFRELDVAAECGFADAEHMKKDDDLASLHDDPRFAGLVERVRATRRGGGETKDG